MRQAIALLLGILLPLLGLSGIGHAQPAVQVQGTIQAVDCQAQTIVLSTTGGSNTIAAAQYAPVLVNSTSVPFCYLEQYIGAPANVWLVASGDQFVATRIDVTGVAVAPVTVPPPPFAVPDAAEASPAPVPIAGIVLGTIIVAGLLYLLTHDHDGGYYRYPYYGSYYRHYYRPEYRPYAGPYPGYPPIITVAPPIRGAVLGRATVGGLEYLVARDHDGRAYRYPYYGPYQRYYYRPGYRPYQGPYLNAPVRQGDPRWDSPAFRDTYNHVAPAYRDPGRVPPPQNVPRLAPPIYQNAPAPQPPHWTPPVYQNAPAPQPPHWTPPPSPNDRRWDGPPNRDPGNHVPASRQGDPRWAPPANQSAPARDAPIRPNNWNLPVYQNDRHHDAPAYHDPRNFAPPPQSDPRWTPPARQDGQRGPGYRDSGGPASPQQNQRWTPPAYQNAPGRPNPDSNPPAYRNDRRPDGPSNHPSSQCGGQGSDQRCSDKQNH
jgi:hypothetical protein